jgi:cell shape-determining protein MreC
MVKSMLACLYASKVRTLLMAGFVSVLLLTSDSASSQSEAPNTRPEQKAKLVESYGKLPLNIVGKSLRSLQYFKVLNSEAIR